MSRFVPFILGLVCIINMSQIANYTHEDGFLIGAEVPQANYDESLIPPFELPDPLVMQDGRKVETADQWILERRPELLALFAENMFGRTTLPRGENELFKITFRHIDTESVFGGKGIRHQYQIQCYQGNAPTSTDPTINVLIYTPVLAAGEKVPAFLGLNFAGNHAISSDSGIHLGQVWKRPNGSKTSELVLVPATDAERGENAHRWPVEKILEKGFGLVTAYYGDIEPDFDGGFRHGVRRFLYNEGESPKPNDGNAIATWSWGLGTILDLLTAEQKTINIDPEHVAVFGHSRLGKTALWAGAIEPRFALTISNNSGCGGAALSRREIGETVWRINTVFPHWFCGNFKKFNEAINSCPIDQHELIALIAPRPVYIASAEEDKWADPKGEFLAGLYASPIYQLLGQPGIGNMKEIPDVDVFANPLSDRSIAYHIRSGKHDVFEIDWEQYIEFAKIHFIEHLQ
ncbi:MAG: acetylxylan esterase [Thermoguttaceae bacterium]